MQRPRRARARGGFVAALIVVSLGAGGWWVWQTRLELRELHELHTARTGLSLTSAALADTLALLRSPGTRVLQIPVTTNGRAGAVTIFADSISHRWLVSVSGLTPNEPDQTYQLWWLTTAGARSAALLPIAGEQPLVLTLAVPDGGITTGVALSIEPRAGSPAPTGPMVFRVTL